MKPRPCTSVYAANKLEELLKHEKKMVNLNACMPFCPSGGKKGCFVANELEELLKPEKEMGNIEYMDVPCSCHDRKSLLLQMNWRSC